MDPLALPLGPVVPVLYVGTDVDPEEFDSLRSQRIGLLVADSAGRAQRVLAHFRVAAIVFATPDLHGLRLLANLGVPIVVLAARDAVCDLDTVTILRRDIAAEDLAAVIHGLVRRKLLAEPTRHAA
jgi:hypothetical protein